MSISNTAISYYDIGSKKNEPIKVERVSLERVWLLPTSCPCVRLNNLKCYIVTFNISINLNPLNSRKLCASATLLRAKLVGSAQFLPDNIRVTYSFTFKTALIEVFRHPLRAVSLSGGCAKRSLRSSAFHAALRYSLI